MIPALKKLLFLFTVCACLTASVTRADEDPEESDFPPGLLAEYKQADITVSRIDPDIAFEWGTAAPDERLNAGPFAVRWVGYFLMKSAGQYRFHAWLDGEVEILLNGQPVLTAGTQQAEWVSGPELEIGFGELPIEVRYRNREKAAAVKLFWSSEQFALEPISTHLLFREQGDRELAARQRGRYAFRSFRCDACHLTPSGQAHSEQPISAPTLKYLQGALEPDWILHKLTQPPDKTTAASKMPHFSLSISQAADISAYLLKHSEKVQLAAGTPMKKPEEVQAGQVLTHAVGCLACHQLGTLGGDNEFGGQPLTEIGSKRSFAWLQTWLTKPEKLFPEHRMPNLQLTDTEIKKIASYLSLQAGDQERPDPELPTSADRIANGKQLIEKLGCAQCHDIPGIQADSEKRLIRINSTNEQLGGCLDSTSNSAAHPAYPQIIDEAIELWLKSWPVNKQTNITRQQPIKHPVSDFQRGQDLLLEKSCVACHPRDRASGFVATAGKISHTFVELNGKSQGLIPPHLTAAGDRLEDLALTQAIAGKQPRRLPWLSIRMPQFAHTEQESQQLLTYLISHDRLPTDIPDERLRLSASALKPTEELLTGRELTGGRAFNCIACHQMGDYIPRNTAVGTRGSNLLGVAGRMRPEYFLRWVMSPLRIVPGMEMPTFNQPRPGFEIHELDGQLSAIWRAINDPTFTAPASPTVVEDYRVVLPEQPAQIVRDVFELTSPGEKERQFVPRPLAIGFENGHSLLFDLDVAALRGWSFGDFAYQQTEGKSWYWYLAGSPVVKSFVAEPELRLRWPAEVPSAELLLPIRQQGRYASLLDYEQVATGVSFRYELLFAAGEQKITVTVTEAWKPLQFNQKTGWQRTIRSSSLPAGAELVWQCQPEAGLLGEPEIDSGDHSDRLAVGDLLTFPFQSELQPAESPAQLLILTYLTDLKTRAIQEFPSQPTAPPTAPQIAGTPGFISTRINLPESIMPTGFCWLPDNSLVFTSLKGDLYRLQNSTGVLSVPVLEKIESGLAAPFGVTIFENQLLVAHKPEILRMPLPESGEHYPSERTIWQDRWGLTDNYHDWTTGFAQQRNTVYIALGSDYSQTGRPEELSQFRGEVLALTPNRSGSKSHSIATQLRYPTGITNDAAGRIFVSDQQGVQNCFNEINHITPGKAFGVPSLYDSEQPEQRACIQLPHPWTRSVNGIFFIPEVAETSPLAPFRGHGIGCEYNNRFLVRFSLQEVAGKLQGACYEFTRPIDSVPPGSPLLTGPLCGGVSPAGEIYIGSIFDSGWLGGRNTGDIVRMQPTGSFPNGIREMRGIAGGFEIEFLQPLPAEQFRDAEWFDLSGYTRVWQGSYATPDSGRYRPQITAAESDRSGRVLKIFCEELKSSYVYELQLKNASDFFPAAAYYTMNQLVR